MLSVALIRVYGPPRSGFCSAFKTTLVSAAFVAAACFLHTQQVVTFSSSSLPADLALPASVIHVCTRMMSPTLRAFLQRHNEQKLREAFERSKDVFLIFSVNMSGHFQGYARMVSVGNQNQVWSLPIECMPSILHCLCSSLRLLSCQIHIVPYILFVRLCKACQIHHVPYTLSIRLCKA